MDSTIMSFNPNLKHILWRAEKLYWDREPVSRNEGNIERRT
ncbi:hypothetical protein [Sulfodiicoccus acidiphilus]|nr:hypothetical protein [Sulfodiicoccus acidiphilus]